MESNYRNLVYSFNKFNTLLFYSLIYFYFIFLRNVKKIIIYKWIIKN
jgi:hypothetical protein